MCLREYARVRTGPNQIAAFCTFAIAFFLIQLPGQASDYHARSLDDFWTLYEFNQLNQKQKKNHAAFAERVREAAVPVERTAEPVRIVVIYPGQQVSDYWRRSLVSFEARLEELRLPYEINSFFSGSSSFVDNQASLISEALKNDPDYLVFTLDALRHRPIVERLIARGRPKILLQNITTPVKAWRDKQPFLYVGFDHLTGTDLLIHYYNQRIGEKKPFAILFGPRGYVSRARGNTFLQAYSDPVITNLRASYYVGYDREKAFNAATEILQLNPDLEFIYSGSTDIALGAVKAIQHQGRGQDVLTNGWGGGTVELDAIIAGQLDVTVMRMNDDNGVAMAEAIALDAVGKGDQVPVVYSGDFELVTSRDSAERIRNLKNRAFRYSQ